MGPQDGLDCAMRVLAHLHAVRRDWHAVFMGDGEVLEEIHLGEHATNCIFDGSDLYVTATREADIEASQRTGTFWRVETDATGLDLIPGRL